MSLAAESVCLRRGDAEILRDIAVQVRPGVMTALVGPNGAGKSSLLRVLSGELAANRGTVCMDGVPLRHIDIARQARFRSVMTQSSNIIFDFLVREVLHFGWVQADRWGTGGMVQAMQTVVTQCDIAHLMHRTFNTLSGGERQRVQFARALLQIWQPAGHREPRYLLLDEPTSSLDLAHELLVLRLARRAADHHAGVLVVLHDLNLAARFCDEVVLMNAGAVKAAGPPRSVLSAETLTAVYGTRIEVEWHHSLDRLIVHT